MSLNLQSLREQVYDRLREDMQQGKLVPGSAVDMARLSETLGVSHTPLREALIQLNVEGFIDMIPRRGFRVATLTLQEVKNLYEMIGVLEGGIILACHRQLTPRHLEAMAALNRRMRQAVTDGNFDPYYEMNLEFHGRYVDLSDNDLMKDALTNMKRRLYDFPRRRYLTDWELANCDEHRIFIELLSSGRAEEAARMMRDGHWSFPVQEKFIRRFYSFDG